MYSAFIFEKTKQKYILRSFRIDENIILTIICGKINILIDLPHNTRIHHRIHMVECI
jgi:hypothetical protein